MVWTREQCGRFLDEVEHDRLFPLFHLVTHYGLRRQELVNLLWSDVDLATRRIHIRGDVKSEDSDRSFILDPGTAGVLQEWYERQLLESAADGWTDSGHVFTQPSGQPLRPAYVSEHFKVIYRQAGLPPVRFHDTRHGAASMLRGQGSDQDDLRHPRAQRCALHR
jgi:integrase